MIFFFSFSNHLGVLSLPSDRDKVKVAAPLDYFTVLTVDRTKYGDALASIRFESV